MTSNSEEFLIEDRVTYTLQLNGKFYLVENVPARVDEETGERFFAPDTVEKIQQFILGESVPDRVIETYVYNYHE